jgi:hypothetical protein
MTEPEATFMRKSERLGFKKGDEPNVWRCRVVDGEVSILREPHGFAVLFEVKRGDAGPECPLGCVVGGLDVAAGEKDEQLVAGIDDDGVSQMAAISVGRLELKQAVELVLEFARVRLDEPGLNMPSGAP